MRPEYREQEYIVRCNRHILFIQHLIQFYPVSLIIYIGGAALEVCGFLVFVFDREFCSAKGDAHSREPRAIQFRALSHG
jgi:hypothetical protein